MYFARSICNPSSFRRNAERTTRRARVCPGRYPKFSSAHSTSLSPSRYFGVASRGKTFRDVDLSTNVELAKWLCQFRREQRGRAKMRRDIGAESTGDFQDTLVIHSASKSDHKSCHERIAGADRVLHFYMRRGRSR